MAWPLTLRSWLTHLKPGIWGTHTGITKLTFNGLGGNLTVVQANADADDGVNVGEDGEAGKSFKGGTVVVAHVSQDEFIPKTTVFSYPTTTKERGRELQIGNKPSLLQFANQNSRINTLVIIPSSLKTMDIDLKAGELWLFGEPIVPFGAVAGVNQSSSPPQKYKMNVSEDINLNLIAGNIEMVDVLANNIKASNVLGDVKFRWDMDDNNIGRMSNTNVKINAQTRLGDVKLLVSDLSATYKGKIGLDKIDLSWIDADEKVRLKTRAATDKGTAASSRRKWLSKLGKDFLALPKKNSKSPSVSAISQENNTKLTERYELYREDTHGVRTSMAIFDDYEEAKAVATEYENKKHHQGYFVRRIVSNEEEES